MVIYALFPLKCCFFIFLERSRVSIPLRYPVFWLLDPGHLSCILEGQKHSRPFLFRSLVKFRFKATTIQLGWPTRKSVANVSSQVTMIQGYGYTLSPNTARRASNDFEIQPWFGLYETSVQSLAYIYILYIGVCLNAVSIPPNGYSNRETEDK